MRILGAKRGNLGMGSSRVSAETGYTRLEPSSGMRLSPISSRPRLQTAASLCTVSGYFCTSRMSSAACALGLARPCSQFSSVRTFVRR